MVLHEKNEREPLCRVRLGRRGQGQGGRAGGRSILLGTERGWLGGGREERKIWVGWELMQVVCVQETPSPRIPQPHPWACPLPPAM